MTDPARKVLTTYKTWAVVGCSPDPSRESHGVAAFMQARGYDIIPVNPGVDSVLGEKCWPDLLGIPDERGVEVVDIFRKSEAAEDVVRDAIQIGAKAVWMQIGVINEAAYRLAEEAGLDVVMDRCPKIELLRRS